jgi:hypothetical protein
VAIAAVLGLLLGIPALRSVAGFTGLTLPMAYVVVPACAAILLWLRLFGRRSRAPA